MLHCKLTKLLEEIIFKKGDSNSVQSQFKSDKDSFKTVGNLPSPRPLAHNLYKITVQFVSQHLVITGTIVVITEPHHCSSQTTTFPSLHHLRDTIWAGPKFSGFLGLRGDKFRVLALITYVHDKTLTLAQPACATAQLLALIER